LATSVSPSKWVAEPAFEVGRLAASPKAKTLGAALAWRVCRSVGTKPSSSPSPGERATNPAPPCRGIETSRSNGISRSSQLTRRLPASPFASSAVRIVYEDGRGILRKVLATSTAHDFKVADVNVDRAEGADRGRTGAVAVALEVHGPGSVAELAAELGEIDGVLSVAAGDVNEMFD
jgi:hypothetical protein